MSQLNKKLEQIKKELITRKQEFEEALAQRSHESSKDTDGKDAGDQALSSTMDTLKRSLQDSEFEEYSRIVQALAKIEEGSYGICVDCQELILEKRLQHYPNAARCLVCQEAYEDQQ